jgi:hypothetical protein
MVNRSAAPPFRRRHIVRLGQDTVVMQQSKAKANKNDTTFIVFIYSIGE